MKKIFLFLVIFALSFGVKAQSWTPIFGKQRFASGLGIPTKDSTYFAGAADSSLIYINPKDAGLYYKYKGYHKKVGTGTVSSVSLSMPSAFSVSGSPITNSGSFVVTGAGSITQYIRGDGSLATFAGAPGTLPVGGTSGQILAKIDGTNYNTEWIDNYSTQIKNIVKLGAALSKGTPVYVSSANGTNMIVSASSYDTEATSSKTFGLLETGGALNDQVKVVTYGLLAGLNTGTAAAGDPVWLGANGALIYGYANKPHAPYHMVFIGIVTRAQSVNGEIFVNVQNGFELDELHNVAAQTPSNNDGLFYESSTSLWKNKSIATVLGYTPEQPLTFSAPLSRSVNTVSIPAATGSVNGYLSSTDWATFNGKQTALSGTGFVKISGTTISYDNSTYLTTSSAASTYVPYTGATSSVNIGNNILTSGYSILNGSGSTNEAGVLSLLKGTSRAVQGNGYTNLYAEAGKVGFVDWITGNVRTFELSLASLTGGTTRVYTLPDASGTIALTSNLTSYVPYTGATGAVNLGAYDLTVNGIKVGRGAGAIGDNTALGNIALNANTTGSGNTALGYAASNANTTAGSNTAVGYFALAGTTTGGSNTAIGSGALTSNSTGTFNTGIGKDALSANTTGQNNVGVGQFANGSNTTASNNSAFGNQALFYNTGANNTAVGKGAGLNLTTGNNNTIIGGYFGDAGMASNVVLSDGAGNIRFQYDGTNTFVGQSGNLLVGVSLNAGYKLDVNGTARISGALSGTSATFSGTITSSRNDAGNISLTLQNSYINQGNLINFIHNSGGTTTNGYIGHGGDNTGNFVIINNGITPVSFARSTGAATFSSSVTAGGKFVTSANISADVIGNFVNTNLNGYGVNIQGGNASNYSLQVGDYTGTNQVFTVLGNGYTNVKGKFVASSTINADVIGNFVNTNSNGYGVNIQGGVSTNYALNVLNYAGTPLMAVNGNGNVGIGTTSPGAKLEVKFTNNLINFEGYYSTTDYIVNRISGGASGTGAFTQYSDGVTYNFAVGTTTNGHYTFNNARYPGSAGTELMRITSGGDLCVGAGTTSSPWSTAGRGNVTIGGSSSAILGLMYGGNQGGYLYHDGTTMYLWNVKVGSSIYVTSSSNGVYLPSGGTAWLSTSDERVKTDLVPIENAAEKVSTLRAVIGRYKTDEVGTRRPFLIAQDVQAVLPEAVNVNSQTGILGLSYTEIIPLLVGAIKELNQKITNLEAQIKK